LSNNAVHVLIIDGNLTNNHMIGNAMPVFQQWLINWLPTMHTRDNSGTLKN